MPKCKHIAVRILCKHVCTFHNATYPGASAAATTKRVCNAGMLISSLPQCRYTSACAACTPQHFVYGGHKFVVVVDAGTQRVRAVLQGHGQKVTAMAASESLEVAVSGAADCSLAAWDLQSLCAIQKKTKLPAAVAAVSVLQARANTALVALASGLVVAWRWERGAPRCMHV